MKIKALYCITAINRLTHEREKVSCMSTSKESVQEIKRQYLLTPARKRTHIYPTISIAQPKLF